MKGFIFVFLISLSVSINAQVIAVDSTIRSTQSSINVSASLNVLVPVKNLTADSVKVNWRRISVSDSVWPTQICDPVNCYQFNQSAGLLTQPTTIAPNATANFSINFLNNDSSGNGHARLEIYIPGGDTSNNRYANVYLAAYNYTAGIKAVDVESLKVYPNPAMDYVLLQNQQGMALNRVELYSMLGRKVISQKISPLENTSRIDLSDMPKGVYMVRVFDEENNVVLTKSISHMR